MSTLPNISTTTNYDSMQTGQDAAPAPDSPAGLIGMFEALIARAISPPSNENTPLKEQNQPVADTTQKDGGPKVSKLCPFGPPPSNGKVDSNVTATTTSAANLPAVTPNTTEVDMKNSHDLTRDLSNIDSNSQPQPGTPTVNVSNLEIIAEQMFAAMFQSDTVQSKPGGQPVASTPSSNSGPIIKPGAVLLTLTQTKGTATAKAATPELSENQTMPATPALSAQKLNPIPDEEGLTPVKTSQVSIKIDQMAIGSADEKPVTEPTDATSKEVTSGISTAAQVPPDLSGTSIAKQSMEMQQAEKTNKFAGQTEKVLPGSVVSAGGTIPTPSFMSNATPSPATVLDTSSITNNTISMPPVDSVIGSMATDLRARTLERTQELVTVNATRLTESGNNSLQVVIKPDAGTQLSLELRQQGGNVEVQAVLQHGDFNHLNQQWSDLQHRLDQRGIKLAPLTDNGATFANSGGSETFQSKQNQTTEGIPQIRLDDAATSLTPTAIFTTEAPQPSTRGGWETWA